MCCCFFWRQQPSATAVIFRAWCYGTLLPSSGTTTVVEQDYTSSTVYVYYEFNLMVHAWKLDYTLRLLKDKLNKYLKWIHVINAYILTWSYKTEAVDPRLTVLVSLSSLSGWSSPEPRWSCPPSLERGPCSQRSLGGSQSNGPVKEGTGRERERVEPLNDMWDY